MGRTEIPNLKTDYERAFDWYGHFNKSEMALFFECTDRYVQNMLDTADIVREAIFRQSITVSRKAKLLQTVMNAGASRTSALSR